jgi:multidrug transporter EmrE-like cation transporter
VSTRGIILVVLCAGIVVLANLALRVGLDRSGVVPFARGIVGLPGDVLTMLLEPIFCLAVVLYGFSMLLWLRLVATEPLSLAYPMLAAVTFVSLSVASVFLLAEPMGLRKTVGLAAIVVGFFLLSGA